MLNIFGYSGRLNKRNKDFQLWQHENHPGELSTPVMINQRLEYMHKNPVKIGLVDKEDEWIHSSAGDYYGTRKGIIDLIFIQ